MKIIPTLAKPVFLSVLLALSAGPLHADALNDLFVDTLAKAEKGDTTAMYDLAGMYAKGVGTSKDFNEAMVWYQEAAQNGSALASYKLGTIYDEARDIPRDPPKAFNWYKKAADQGNKKARKRVSEMYAKGDGTSRDAGAADAYSKPVGASAPAPKKSVAKSTPKPKKAAPKKRANRSGATIDVVLNSNWKKRNRPSIYLPSESAHCNKNAGKLSCVSKKLTGQQFNKNYTYRVKSELKNFTPDGYFDVSIEFQLVSISDQDIEGYGDEAGDDVQRATAGSINQELKNRSELISCDLAKEKDSISCISSNGRPTKFTL
ncbi:MAG: tetratricopeptide repeat protein [bacterium]